MHSEKIQYNQRIIERLLIEHSNSLLMQPLETDPPEYPTMEQEISSHSLAKICDNNQQTFNEVVNRMIAL